MGIIETTITETNSIEIIRDKLKTILKKLILDVHLV